MAVPKSGDDGAGKVMESLDIILQRLNEIDKTQDDIAGRFERVNLYIAKSEEREGRQPNA